jgi:hypothetical protein
MKTYMFFNCFIFPILEEIGPVIFVWEIILATLIGGPRRREDEQR